MRVTKDIHFKEFGAYEDKFTEIDHSQESFFNKNPLDSTYEQRLYSSVINNQAVLQFLSITDETPTDIREKMLSSIHKMFSEAESISDNTNSVSSLNRLLLEWQLGILKDEDF